MVSVVKLSKKEKLDQLLARITLQTGRKPTQQEVLDMCVEIGEEHFEELLAKIVPFPVLDDKKVEDIIKLRKEFSKYNWDKEKCENFSNDDDADIYLDH